MNDESGPAATDIQLHQKSRLLEMTFENGRRFELPCEYLRVFSPSAEVKALEEQGEILHGKEGVNITAISPVGNYAIQITFDDGHDTGVYSWEMLYKLGEDRDSNWQAYLDKLNEKGLAPEVREKQVRVLYSAILPDILGLEDETETIPVTTNTITDLVQFLRMRGGVWDKTFKETVLKVTINQRFADLDSIVRDGDEIALIPVPPEGMDADGA